MPFVAFALALALQQAPTAPPAPIAASPQDPKELFSKAKCVFCHGEDGRSRTQKGKKLKEDLDNLLDEIDEILEENAEEFVKSYVQRGGQ